MLVQLSITKFRRYCDQNEVYNSLLNIGKSYCSLDLSIYFKVTFLIDMLVENIDRHTKNIGVIYNKDLRKFRIAPVFDNGRSLGIGISPDETPCARTISGSFANQVTATCGFPVKSVFTVKLKYFSSVSI